MRRPKGEKVSSSHDPENRVKSLEEEKPKIAVEKRKELTFKFEFDTKVKRFELTPLSEKNFIAKAEREIGK